MPARTGNVLALTAQSLNKAVGGRRAGNFSSDTKYGLRHPAAASHPLASRWPRLQQQFPVSATGGGHCCCRPFHRPPYCLRQQGPTPADGPRRNYRLTGPTDAACRYGLFGENAFGALRVCVAMKAPVGLLSGERSASADGGALPRQVPQSATNAKEIKFPLFMARAKRRPFKIVCFP